jgi:HTH-type transcriptional regulator / antitoxin HipB
MAIRTPRELGLIIRDRRHTLGLGQEELARRIGVSRQWVINIEKGKPTAEVGLILKALVTLGFTLDVHSEGLARSKPEQGQADIDAVIKAALRKRA